MAQSDERHILQATYQSNLIHAISDVIFRMNNNDVFGTFNALETLYIILPIECYKMVEPIHDQEFKKIFDLENKIQSIDYAVRQMNLTNKKLQLLQSINKILFKTYKDILESKNYLDITKYRPTTRESTVQNIGAKINQ
ncbi:MAG: hypothetical protein WC272_11800 [Sulfurimonas sp.]|jgi:hypothetical protein